MAERWPAILVATGAVALLLIGRLAATIWLYRTGFESLSGDGFLRTLLAADWAARPYLAAGGVWLPGHMVSLGALVAVTGDLVLIPRLFSIGLGLIAIALVAAVGTTLGRDARAGVVAAAVLTFDPVMLWVSATPLNENLYLALTLLALLAIIRYDRAGSIGWVIFASVFLTLANSVRFEAWLFSAVFAGVLTWWVVRRRLPARALVAAGFPLMVPATFSAANWFTFADPLFWPNAFRAYNVRAYGPGPDPGGLATALWIAQGPILAIIIVAAVWAARQARPIRLYLLLVGVPAVIVLVALAAGREPINNLLRYLAPFHALMCPLVGAMAIAMWDALPRPTLVRALAMTLAGGLLVSRVMVAGAPPPEPSASGLAVGQRIAELRAAGSLPQGPLIVDSNGLAVYAMMVGASDIQAILLDRPIDPARRMPPILGLDPERVAACVGSANAVGVVARSPEVERLPGAQLLAVVNGYRIVRLQPGTGGCPGETVRWPDVARDTTGRLFAALAYSPEG
ncbi:MAG: hypothetical protein KatS3mg060_1590 [Dehalococcoidia bacterium]|nr:MAG: hypothetical protein KatS3mg060_1590 [Dehalococcoidia bacterium]